MKTVSRWWKPNALTIATSRRAGGQEVVSIVDCNRAAFYDRWTLSTGAESANVLGALSDRVECGQR